MKTSGTATALALAVLILPPAFSQGQSQSGNKSGKNHTFEFTQVVDTTKGFSSFGVFPAINNHGEVAFTAIRTGHGAGVFRVREELEKLTTIGSTSDGLDFFGDDVAVNPDGVVAFGATTTANSRAIFKGDGTSRTLIADSSVNGLLKIAVGSPSINAAGVIAFSAVLAQRGSPSSVFTGNGGPLKAVASTSVNGFQSFGNVAINNSGTVVFPGNLTDGSHGLFTVSGGATIDIVDTATHSEIDSFGDPVINNAGAIADVAFVLPLFAPEIITGTTRGVTPRNDPTNPAFASTEHPSINNHGAVAFSAIQVVAGGTSPEGIFLEVSGGRSLIPVVRPGDKLFGSTVVHANLGRFALNDRFQMAFSYTLQDGRSGIAIASFEGEGEDGGKGGDDSSH